MDVIEWIFWYFALVFGVVCNTAAFTSDIMGGRINSFTDFIRSQFPTAIAFLIILILIYLASNPNAPPIGGRKR